MSKINYVNTKQGSNSVHRFSNGNTLPLVQMPFGMVAFAPQTSSNIRWYYNPHDRSFEGIRLTHQPSPWIADYGAMVFLPQKMPLKLSGDERWSGIRPEDAILTPNYLNYRLLRYKCNIELTPTERCAKFRVSFDDEGENYLSILPVKGEYGYYWVPDKNELCCYTTNSNGGEVKDFCEYVVVKFGKNDVDPDNFHTGNIDSGINKGRIIAGSSTSIHVKLNNKVTEFSVATSYISYEQAELSLAREIGSSSFDEIKEAGEKVWEEYLSRVEIETDDEEKYKTFVSCMYRAFLYPHKCYELNEDNKPFHYCPHDGKVRYGVRYTDNGFWDTYRTVYPFFSLVAKDEMRDMLVSFIHEYEESGWLPRWLSIGEHGCMPSTLIDAVICDASVKGLVSKEDMELALKGMLKHATTNSPEDRFGRNGAESYCKLGYVPYDEQKESVNLTQDAAYGDWCIAEMAKLLGYEDIEKEYRVRAKNYLNIFDKESGFMRAKDSNGEFRPDFIPEGWGRDYTEGSAWQNSFAVPHDIEGLADAFGGKDKLIAKIDELFAKNPDYVTVGYTSEIHEITEMAAADFGQCAISNQPSFHIPYIYSALGNVEKTAYWVEKLCNEAFSYKDDGFPGDEDNGTMAIWYIFSLLGIYPFCPGKPEFVKGKKQVKKAFIMGKEFDADKFESIIPYDEVK